MRQMPPNKTFITLAYLSLLPLLFALFLSIYFILNLATNTGYFFNFARINSYIIAHSYGALLLALFAGIQIGQTMQNKNRWYLFFNFILLWLAWISYQSFADAQGVLLLLSCWVAAFFIDLRAKPQNCMPNWYGSLKIKINLITVLLLLLILILNSLKN